MAEPILTRARQAVWEAIDNWPALAGQVRRRYRFEDMAALAPGWLPPPGDLTALAIAPGEDAQPTTSEWIASQTLHLSYTVQVRLWTAGGSLAAGERLWEEIARAVLKAGPVGERSYVAAATGDGAVDFGPLTVHRVALAAKGPTALEWRWALGLRLRWQPML